MQVGPDTLTTNHSSRSRLFVIVFCLAFMVRLLNIAALPTETSALLQGDSSLYWSGAAVLLEHGSFSKAGEGRVLPQTERVPGYFIFLAGIQALFGTSLLVALIVQSALDSLTCLLIAGLASQLASQLAFPAGILAALSPNLVIHSGTILSDTLFLFFFTVMLVASSRFLIHAEMRWAALAGLALGLSILTRPVAQLLPFLMVPAAIILPLRYRRGARATALITIVFLAGAILPLTPLIHRNYTEFATLTLTSQTGAHLAGWVAPLVRRASDGTPREKGAYDLNAEAQAHLKSNSVQLEELNPFEHSQMLSRIGLNDIARHRPSAIARAWVYGATINLAAPSVSIDSRVRNLPHPSFDGTPGDSLYKQTFNFLSGSSISYLAIMGSGIALSVIFLCLQGYGFFILIRISPWAALFAALGVGYFLAINGPIGSPKYRLPFEPILIVLSALALVNMFNRAARR